ncbi:MAG TPA: FimV/HubP family polar landmark protein [Casimicrobiaceae bacterium]|nr:FimV/HubP family polar landmark protein [Casimicrobiaceae bacterium]
MRAKPIHTISLLASAIALALPSSSMALGLGRLTVQSALGQPLSAQIELTSAAREELDSLAAKVADPTLYRQNNLTYQGVLSRARVTVERNSNGQAFLRVVTATPVNEPYLDLMVELNWAAGRVVREYTFLLDPPGVAAPTPAVEPVTPRAGAGSASRAVTTAGVPAPSRVEGTDTPREIRGATSSRSADSYNVRRGDSLARIANQLKPDGVTLEQMLAALYKANPSAFEGGNMNRLRAGSILTVPAAQDIAGTPESDAAKLVRMQAADWRTYRDRVAAGATPSESAGARESTGKITTSVQDKTPAAPVARDQVRVSREAGTGKGGAGVAAVEDAVARDRALRDAEARIAQLEKTIQDLQRAVEMRNQTMAQLQNQSQAGKAAPEPAKGAPSAAGVAPVTAPAPVKVPEPVAKAPEPARAAEAPKTDTAKAEPPKAEVAAGAAPAAATAAPAPKAPTKPVAKPAAEPSFMDEVIASPPWVWIAGGIALLAGVGGIVALRRRKTSSFEDSIISGTDIKSNTVFGSTGGGIVNTGENSLSSDFSREGLSTIDTDEVDPIAEAEVYLAYGRDAQAEEILKDALKKDPARQEVYLKLLEIHAQHNKPSACETVAGELYSVSRGQGEIWQKAVALGRQLDPNNPMFAEGGAGVAAGAAAAGAAVAASMQGDPTQPVRRPPEPSRSADVPPVPVGMADLEQGMDFRLDDDISITPQGDKKKGVVDTHAVKDEHALEFDGAALSRQRTPERAMSKEPEAARAEAGFNDLDFHLEDSEKPTPVRAGGEPAPTLARPQAAIDLDKLDLSFDPERSTFEDPTPSVLDGQWHDAATKLDLAKAYQEMGDVEGAREILQEVLHEGDDQQKGEAGALLSKLA